MQQTKLPNLISILILTLITALMWVGFSIFSVFTQPPTVTVPSEVLASLKPNLDTDTIGKVESSLSFNESEIPNVAFTGSPVPTAAPTLLPTPTESPIASASGAPTVSPTP